MKRGVIITELCVAGGRGDILNVEQVHNNTPPLLSLLFGKPGRKVYSQTNSQYVVIGLGPRDVQFHTLN